MAEVAGVFFVLAASVSWYVSKSLQSKVDPDKDGYGEGTQYVKHKENNMPSYNITVQPAVSTKFVVVFIQDDDCKEKADMADGAYVEKYIKMWGLDRNTDLRMKCREKQVKIPYMDRNKKFIEDIVKEVSDLLDTGHRVLLAGHSYGGQLACHVAGKLMHKLQDVHNDVNRYVGLLHVATFANTLLYDNNLYHNMTVTHYMIKDDISSKKQKKFIVPDKLPAFDKDNKIFWLPHRAKLGFQFGPFSSVRSELHQSYDDVISAVIKNQGTILNIEDVSLY